MIVSLAFLVLGLVSWAVGYYYGGNDTILKGIYSLPGFVVTLVSLIAIAFCWRWWLGLIVAMAISAALVVLYRTM